MASPDGTSGAAIRLAAALLPVLLGGGTALFGWVNPFWQLLFGSGVVFLSNVLPAPADGHWNPIAVALVPWLIAALLFALGGKVARLPRISRRLTLLAYASSFAVVAPAAALPALGPLPFYATLAAHPQPL